MHPSTVIQGICAPKVHASVHCEEYLQRYPFDRVGILLIKANSCAERKKCVSKAGLVGFRVCRRAEVETDW